MIKKLLNFLVMILIIPACFKKEQPYVPIINNTEPPISSPIVAPEAYNNDIIRTSLDPVESYNFNDTIASGDIILENMDDNISWDNVDKHENSVKYGFQPVYYQFNKKNIDNDQKKNLDENLKIAKNLAEKNYTILLEGHACHSAGTPQYNLVLSEDRAKFIADYFESEGISKDNILTVARGSENNIVPFGNKEQQGPNRRVELYAYLPKNQKDGLQEIKT